MKVAIIGAGTNGLYLAWKLSKKGYQVTVFERKNKIGNKVCSGLFSQRILDFIPQSKNLIQKKINSILIHFPKKTVKVTLSRSFFLMSHFELDKLLIDLAEKSGTEIILNKNISSVPENFDKVIGCDGADSFVREYLKEKKPRLRLGIQGFVDENSKNDFVEAFPCKNGFFWKIFRTESIEYGVITDINKAYRSFVDFIKKNNIKIKNVKAKIIPQGLVIPNNKKITLCGDAAGLTKPWSGGGVIWGFTAADILLKTFPDFILYRKKTRRFFIPKILLSKTAIKLVYFLGYNFPYFLPKNVKIESDFIF